MGRITSVCLSKHKGTRKTDKGEAEFVPGHGLLGDAHAGDWHRQVSLLAEESIARTREMGLDVKEGDFGENLTTRGIDLAGLPLGTRLAAGEVLLEVTQIGKVCHHKCAIYYQAGDCIMPKEGIFAKVLKGGVVRKGDEILVDNRNRIGILTCSDKGYKGEREDKSAQVIKDLVGSVGNLGYVCEYVVVPDEIESISQTLRSMTDDRGLDLILTTGGTGFGPRDVTPEATLEAVERLVPGLSELMRTEGAKHTPKAALSRAIAGIRKRTLIVNLPGSPKGVAESLRAILPVLPHGLEILRGTAGECG